MLGSYGPHPQGEAYIKNFDSEEAPSGMLARGSYNVRSRVVDDDGEVYAGMRCFCLSSQHFSFLTYGSQTGNGLSSSLRSGDYIDESHLSHLNLLLSFSPHYALHPQTLFRPDIPVVISLSVDQLKVPRSVVC